MAGADAGGTAGAGGSGSVVTLTGGERLCSTPGDSWGSNWLGAYASRGPEVAGTCGIGSLSSATGNNGAVTSRGCIATTTSADGRSSRYPRNNLSHPDWTLHPSTTSKMNPAA